MIVLPPLTERMLDAYGWRGAMLIHSGLSFHFAICGMLIRPYQQQYKSVPANDNSDEVTKDDNESKYKNRDWNICSTMLQRDVFIECPGLIWYLAAFSLYATPYTAWMIFLVPDALSKGFTAQSGALLSTMGGVGTFIGSIAHSPFIDHRILSADQLFVVLCIMCSVSFLVDPYLHSYALLIVSAVNVGITTGALYSICIVLTKDAVKNDVFLVTAIAWMQFTFGLAKIGGGPLAGNMISLPIFKKKIKKQNKTKSKNKKKKKKKKKLKQKTKNKNQKPKNKKQNKQKNKNKKKQKTRSVSLSVCVSVRLYVLPCADISR